MGFTFWPGVWVWEKKKNPWTSIARSKSFIYLYCLKLMGSRYSVLASTNSKIAYPLTALWVVCASVAPFMTKHTLIFKCLLMPSFIPQDLKLDIVYLTPDGYKWKTWMH